MADSRNVYVIDENTKIPVKLAWTAALALVAIAMSFATVLVKQETVRADVSRVENRLEEVDHDRLAKRDQFTDAVNRIDQRLSRIEGKLGVQGRDGR